MQLSTCSQAVDALRQGSPVIFPTDTVYGLGLSVGHASSPAVLFDLKGRAANKPVAWLVGGVADLDRFGRDVPAWAKRLAGAYWPGSLTLIVRASDSVPASFCSEAGTIGLRMPNNATALELIQGVGFPLATTSANYSGCAAASSIDGLDAVLAQAVGVVVSDQLPKSGLSSTVVDCTHDKPCILRQGFVSAADVQSYL